MITKISSDRWLAFVGGALIFKNLDQLNRDVPSLWFRKQVGAYPLSGFLILMGLACVGIIVGVRLFRSGRSCIDEAIWYLGFMTVLCFIFLGFKIRDMAYYSVSWPGIVAQTIPVILNVFLLKVLLNVRSSAKCQ